MDFEYSERTRMALEQLQGFMDEHIYPNEATMIKVKAPNMALRVIDDAIQAHGGGGVTEDFGLAAAYASMRTLRLGDGPDEVHRRTVARLELKRQAELAGIPLER